MSTRASIRRRRSSGVSSGSCPFPGREGPRGSTGPIPAVAGSCEATSPVVTAGLVTWRAPHHENAATIASTADERHKDRVLEPPAVRPARRRTPTGSPRGARRVVGPGAGGIPFQDEFQGAGYQAAKAGDGDEVEAVRVLEGPGRDRGPAPQPAGQLVPDVSSQVIDRLGRDERDAPPSLQRRDDRLDSLPVRVRHSVHRLVPRRDEPSLGQHGTFVVGGPVATQGGDEQEWIRTGTSIRPGADEQGVKGQGAGPALVVAAQREYADDHPGAAWQGQGEAGSTSRRFPRAARRIAARQAGVHRAIEADIPPTPPAPHTPGARTGSCRRPPARNGPPSFFSRLPGLPFFACTAR